MATTAGKVSAPTGSYAYYEVAFEGVDAPFAFVDLDAMWENAESLLMRARGKPIRVASKSVRCRALLRSVLERDPGFRGLMTFTLAETMWLHRDGFGDLLLAYPTADSDSLRALTREDAPDRPIVMVDSIDGLDLIERAIGEGGNTIRVCIDFDTSFWMAGGRVRIGPKRSPIRTPNEAAGLARDILRRKRFELAGIMGYEGHIAGVGDKPLGKPFESPAIRKLQRASAAEIAERRAAIAAAVRAVAPIELVNGGGTGSLETTAVEPAVTEVAAGSGFFAPMLFDRYSAFSLRPAAMFALPVVRKPTPEIATALGGGYHASGAAGRDRLPEPHLPAGLSLDRQEGAGEVQTPLLGEPARTLRVGDRVYFRHAKAGELCERFETLRLVADGRVVDEVPTYRGEGRCFL